ncbi:MAG: amino acid ABC transporter permease [Lachnospiraceae bacterium]|nr:amino acid ABC transporter permease [Lachnospiraceae bacterium]
MSRYGHVFLLEGVAYTLLLSLIAVAGGSVLGALFAFGKRGKIPPLRILINALVEIVRGTPLLLQLYAGVFILPRLIPALNELPDIVSVSVVLIINSAAYVSEVIRSGIQAVDIGQTEAARSLGLSERTTMWNVVLPQAVKNILPALGNEFITVIKETSLASTFYVGDLMTSYLKVRGNTFLTLECLTIVGILYFILTFTLSKLLAAAERRMKHA